MHNNSDPPLTRFSKEKRERLSSVIKNKKVELYASYQDKRDLYDEESSGLLIDEDKTDNELIMDIHNLSQSTLS